MGGGGRTLHGWDVRDLVTVCVGDCGVRYVGQTAGEYWGRAENRGVPCCVTPAARCWRAVGPNCRTYPGSHFSVCRVGGGGCYGGTVGVYYYYYC